MSTKKQGSRSTRLILVAFLLSGAAALIYEVTWTRALALVLGSTTYAVSTMLATFMAGLALGAFLGGRLADRRGDLVFQFGVIEMGIGLTGILSVPLIYALPRAYLGLYRAFHLYPAVFFPLQIALCALVMLIPTTLMGATFPLVSRAITERLAEMGSKVGQAYSFNTVGAVAGSLIAGFVLIPRLGLKGAVLTAGLLNLMVGLGMIVRSRRRAPVLPVALLALYLPATGWTALASSSPTLFSFYSAHRHLDGRPFESIVAEDRMAQELVFARSYAEGEVRAFRTPDGYLLLQVGGKIEGTGERDMSNTLLLSYLPIAAHPAPERMLVIGLGAGVTLAAAKEHVEKVELVEINPGVLEAVSRFGPPGLLEGVRIVRDDARNFLMVTEDRYDIISSEPSYPTESVVTNLFTREYYQVAAHRLSEGGIYCQWLPYHIMTNDDVTMMIKTFASVFPHTYLWRVTPGLDLILLGSREPFTGTAIDIRSRVSELNSQGWPLGYLLSREPGQIAEIVGRDDVPINTDDHPILEFRVARNLLVGDLGLIEDREGGDRRPGR